MLNEHEDSLTVHLGDAAKGVNADDYLAFLQNALAALKELDKESSTYGSETVQWEIVATGYGSPLFATIRGRPASDGERSRIAIAKFVSGLDELNRGNRAPTGFGEPALRCLATLGTYARRLSPFVSAAGKRVEFSESLADNANWAIRTIAAERRYYKEHGSLRGTLKTVTSVRAQTDKVILVDRLTGEETQCYFHSKDIEAAVREGWKHRVVVTGDIYVDRRTRKRHKVLIRELRIIPTSNELPQLADLTGIDITEGIDSAEYVRRMRDDE